MNSNKTSTSKPPKGRPINRNAIYKGDRDLTFSHFIGADIIANALTKKQAYEDCGCKRNPNQTNINWPYKNTTKLDIIEGKYEVVWSINLSIEGIGPIVIGQKSILNITSSKHPLYSEIKELYSQNRIKKL